MEEDKKVNEVETSILENPLNNTKIDITSDLTKMVEEIKNIESTSIKENNEVVEQEKDVPVIEPKSVLENVVSTESSNIESTPVVDKEVVPTNVQNTSEAESKIDTSTHDGTVITTISSEVENKPEVEKKKLPVNLFAILIVIIVCIALGIFLWYFFRNEDGSYKTKYFEYLGKEENKNENIDNQDDKPVVTSSDDFVTPSDDVTYTFNSGKYVFNNRTLYLNNNGTFYYIIADDSCPTSYFGDYTVDGNMIDLTSTASYGCVECGHTSESNLTFYVFNIRSDGRISLNNEVFDYIGFEESEVTPLTCSNENAN